jgi:hypothetical protein
MSNPSSDPVSFIRNLGPKTDAAFARAGITTAQQVRDLGADETYLRYLQHGGTPHFIGFYCVVLGLQGRPWNDAQPDEKVKLRKRFDAIKAKAASSKPASARNAALEKELDALGVRAKP